MNIELTEEGKKRIIAFSGRSKSTLPLGERHPSDIRDLAIMAVRSGSKSLLPLFVPPLPDLQQMLMDQVDEKIADGPASAKAKDVSAEEITPEGQVPTTTAPSGTAEAISTNLKNNEPNVSRKRK